MGRISTYDQKQSKINPSRPLQTTSHIEYNGDMKDSDLLHPDLLDHDLLNMTLPEFRVQVGPNDMGDLVEELYSEGFSPDEALEIIEFYTFPLQSTPE
jgi:hypothetical protein